MPVKASPQRSFNFRASRSEATNGDNKAPEVHLLLELENEVIRWRRRTMFLLSIVFHAVLIVVLLVSPDLLQRLEHALGVQVQPEQPKDQITFLALPPDLEKLRQTPRTNILSDKDRQAQGRAPLINPYANRMPYSRGNTPLPEEAGGRKNPPSPPPAPQQPAAGANNGARAAAKPPPAENQEAKLKLEDVPAASESGANLKLPSASPGEAIQQSLQAASRGRSSGQFPGSGGGPGQFNNPNSSFSIGGMQVLSDTRGVDFGPYLRRVIAVVRQNWYDVIPESARLGQKGICSVDFAIQVDGSVPGLDLSSSSGSEALDRAAEAGIHASTPFEPLPSEYLAKGGRDLKLRFIFLYNEGIGP